MGKRAQERRAAKDLARHMVNNQVMPQIVASEMRAQGIKVETPFVNTDPDAEGFQVACVQCGRTAKMATAPAEGQVVVCPACARRMRP